MSDTAVWLTEHVIPRVQIRHWVYSLPWELRVRAGYDRDVCAMVLDTFVRELQRSYRWRAKRELGLSSEEDAFTGTVTVIQRFDSALRSTTGPKLISRGFGGRAKTKAPRSERPTRAKRGSNHRVCFQYPLPTNQGTCMQFR